MLQVKSSQDTLRMLIRYNGIRNSRKHFTFIYRFIIKDTSGQADEEVCRVRSKRIPSTGVSLSSELRSDNLLAHGFVYQPGKLSKPLCSGFLWRFHYIDMID